MLVHPLKLDLPPPKEATHASNPVGVRSTTSAPRPHLSMESCTIQVVFWSLETLITQLFWPKHRVSAIKVAVSDLHTGLSAMSRSEKSGAPCAILFEQQVPTVNLSPVGELSFAWDDRKQYAPAGLHEAPVAVPGQSGSGLRDIYNENARDHTQQREQNTQHLQTAQATHDTHDTRRNNNPPGKCTSQTGPRTTLRWTQWSNPGTQHRMSMVNSTTSCSVASPDSEQVRTVGHVTVRAVPSGPIVQTS